MLITDGGKVIRMETAEIRCMGRVTQGVRLIVMVPGERVVSAAGLAESEADDDTLAMIDMIDTPPAAAEE